MEAAPADMWVVATYLYVTKNNHTQNAPTFLQVAGGNEVATATWRAPTWDGGGIHTISGYTIQFSIDAGTTWTTVVANTASTTPYHVVTGLSNGTSYQFRVAALNQEGTGAYSSSSQKVIPSAERRR